MIREVLGFHAEVDPTVGGNGASPVFALAGCTDFNDKVNRRCGAQETTIHVSVDSWIGSYASTESQFAKEYPRLAAEDLGSMGYLGEESMYVSRAILNAAYSESGLALDFYKSHFACFSVAFFVKTSGVGRLLLYSSIPGNSAPRNAKVLNLQQFVSENARVELQGSPCFEGSCFMRRTQAHTQDMVRSVRMPLALTLPE